VLNGSGIDASIREGGNGQFDVLRDGELLFSKRSQGRFPDEDEILDLLR
jgi:predicted Rdx family selenoprotein